MRNVKRQETKEEDEQKYQVYYTTQEKHQEFRTEPHPRKLFHYNFPPYPSKPQMQQQHIYVQVVLTTQLHHL